MAATRSYRCEGGTACSIQPEPSPADWARRDGGRWSDKAAGIHGDDRAPHQRRLVILARLFLESPYIGQARDEAHGPQFPELDSTEHLIAPESMWSPRARSCPSFRANAMGRSRRPGF